MTNGSGIKTETRVIGMTAATVKDGAKHWLGYTAQGTSDGALEFDDVDWDGLTRIGSNATHDAPGDRQLDLDLRTVSVRTKYIFRIAADYRDHGIDYTVKFSRNPFQVGVKGGPDVSHLIENVDVSRNRKEASFEFDRDAVKRWRIAKNLRGVNCPVVRIPFAFDFDDEQFNFPSWMLPEPGDPAYGTVHPKGVEALLWHGGPHPPVNSFLVIPTGA